MSSDSREPDTEPKSNAEDTVWRRLVAQLVRGLSGLLEASEHKRKRPRNLYVRSLSGKGLGTRPHGE